MSLHARRLGLLLFLLILLGAVPVAAQSEPEDTQYRQYLPIMLGAPHRNPFGFDVRITSNDAVIPFATAARPKWARAGDVFWSDVEPVRGGGYHWEALAGVEANINRLRAAGIEPTLVIQRTPAWAQREQGRLCSPPKPLFANFSTASPTTAASTTSCTICTSCRRSGLG